MLLFLLIIIIIIAVSQSSVEGKEEILSLLSI